MTKDEAIALAETKWWEARTDEEIVRFQLFESRCCMSFSRFQAAVEAVLKRPVFTHEFASVARLRAEYLGDRPAPTMQEILDLIPEAKRIVVVLP